MVVVSVSGRERPLHILTILLRPILFARHIFLAVYPNIDLRRRYPAAQDLRDFQLCAYAQCGNSFLKKLGRNSGIDESSQKHVAADAGEAFEIGNAHKKDRVFIIGKLSKRVKRPPAADSVKISVSSMI